MIGSAIKALEHVETLLNRGHSDCGEREVELIRAALTLRCFQSTESAPSIAVHTVKFDSDIPDSWALRKQREWDSLMLHADVNRPFSLSDHEFNGTQINLSESVKLLSKWLHDQADREIEEVFRRLPPEALEKFRKAVFPDYERKI